MSDRKPPPSPPIKWNQVCRGNASDRTVLDEYMATADYSQATAVFTVTAEIAGQLASVRVGPGGEVLS